MKYKVLRHQSQDTVGIVIEKVMEGQSVLVKDITGQPAESISVKETIPIFHKIALQPMKKHELVIEYGQVIGEAMQDIECGAYVHIHNIKTRKW